MWSARHRHRPSGWLPSGIRTSPAVAFAPRTARGRAASPAATGSTRCRPSRSPSARGARARRRRGCSSRGARTRANQAGIPCRAWSSSASSGTGATCGTSLPVRRLPKAPRASPQARSGCTRAACRRVRCRPRPADTDRAETVCRLAEPLGRGANFARFALKQAVHHARVRFQEALDLRAGEHQASQRTHARSTPSIRIAAAPSSTT